jgi:DMSO reductase anchor subunit
MHPAYSIIFFTTASGLGYGLLALLGVYGAFGLAPQDRWFGLAALGLALGAVTFGLLSSTFHLGHPERAWRAVTQWRSSWLSREGVMALVTYVPAGLFGLGWVFFERTGGLWAVAGLLVAAGAAVTVYCTSMIYASLKAVPRWHNRWVPANYLALALLTGVVWLDALLRLFGVGRIETPALVIGAAAFAWALKAAYWSDIDGAAPVTTADSATGLGPLGKVRLLDPPHTYENYLQKEMGFQVARKHAQKLRRLAVLLGFAVPLAGTLAAMPLPGLWHAALALVVALSASLGVVIERWLFFAEARHVVTLYYGARAA